MQSNIDQALLQPGGSIGTGLFVGSGAALNRGGPAGLLVCWTLIGMMLINVTQACLHCRIIDCRGLILVP